MDLEAQTEDLVLKDSPLSPSLASTGLGVVVEAEAAHRPEDPRKTSEAVANALLLDSTPASLRRRCLEHVFTYWLALLVALLVALLFTTAGLLGVITISNSVRTQRMNDAMGTAFVHARVVAEELRLTTVPLMGIANYVRSTPRHDWSTIHAGFNDTARRLVELLANSGLDERLVIQIAPSAVVNLSFPREGNEAAEGHNLLADPKQRENALIAIRSQELFLAGPYMLKQGYVGAPARLPIFLPCTSAPGNCTSAWAADENFGNPETPSNCPADLCRGTDFFWGFAVMLINWDAVSSASKIAEFSDDGYMFRLERPPQSDGDTQTILAQSYDMVNRTSFPEEPRFVEFQALTSRWTLYVYVREGWTPNWRAPLIAVVVIISFFLSVLVFIVMASNKKLRKTTESLTTSAASLESEQARLSALLVRQFELLQIFGTSPMATSGQLLSGDDGSTTLDRIASVRKSMQNHGAAQLAEIDRIVIQELLGEGAFGKVYKGLWRGTTVAVKCIVMPAGMSRSARAEKMAVMEAAISSTMCHPHLVQTFTYSIRPLCDTSGLNSERLANTMGSGIVMGKDVSQAGSTCVAAVVEEMQSAAGSGTGSGAVHSYEVRLVLEFCDGGDLMEMVQLGIFHDDKGLNYSAILETAADIAKGMLHLHVHNILHADMKASNVMLKSSAIDGRGMVGKVVDFGLAIQLDTTTHQTHMSNMIQGTMTHMAPEIMLEGKQSKSGDVYAFGITLYELIMAERPYIGIANAMLGHQVVHDRKRPVITQIFPMEYRLLAERCWAHDPEARPTFDDIVVELTAMRARIKGRSRPLIIPTPRKNSSLSCELPPPIQVQLSDDDGECDSDGDGAPDSPIVISGPLSSKLLLLRSIGGLDPIVEGDGDASEGVGSFS